MVNVLHKVSPKCVDLTPEKANICAFANAGIEFVLSRGQVTIANFSVDNGNTAAVCHYDNVPSRPIKESTVRGYVKKYKQRLLKVQNPDYISLSSISELPV